MRFITIDSIPLRAAAVSLGLAELGAGIPEAEGYRLLDAYLDRGGNFLDTARVYSDWVPGETGRSERVLGDWLAKRGCRSRVVLATKGGHFPLEAPHISRLNRAGVTGDVESSLRALRTDVIDLYYLHRDNRALPVEEILGFLEDLVRAGKIRRYACSNWRADRMEEAHRAAEMKGCSGFAANQIHWNLGSANGGGLPDKTCETFDGAMRAAFVRTGMLAVAYSSQAGGYFAKLYRGAAPGGHYDTPGNRRVYEKAGEIARRAGMGVTDVVLAYILCQPFPTAAVVGCRTVEQLAETMDAAEKSLPPALLAELEETVGQQ